MKQHKVFQHPNGKIDAVKVGWSWPAFFFLSWWCLFKRLWGILAILLCTAFASGVLLYFATGSEEKARDIGYVVIVFMRLISGLYGNDWRCRNLLSRGFRHVATFDSLNRESAIAKLYWDNIENEEAAQAATVQ